MTSLGTQIMFPHKFVEFLEQTMMLLELLYDNHVMYIPIIRMLGIQV
jgi:hypothetical protein